MTPEEIRQEVSTCFDLIEKEFNPAIFVYNKKIAEAYTRIQNLQDVCEHKFDEYNVCIYCRKHR